MQSNKDGKHVIIVKRDKKYNYEFLKMNLFDFKIVKKCRNFSLTNKKHIPNLKVIQKDIFELESELMDFENDIKIDKDDWEATEQLPL
jgi:hypothetical protein